MLISMGCSIPCHACMHVDLVTCSHINEVLNTLWMYYHMLHSLIPHSSTATYSPEQSQKKKGNLILSPTYYILSLSSYLCINFHVKTLHELVSFFALVRLCCLYRQAAVATTTCPEGKYEFDMHHRLGFQLSELFVFFFNKLQNILLMAIKQRVNYLAQSDALTIVINCIIFGRCFSWWEVKCVQSLFSEVQMYF